MTLFEVTDRDGAVILIDCETHCIGAESGGPVVHDFVGVKGLGEWQVFMPDGIERRTTPTEMRFTAPQSVREVPA